MARVLVLGATGMLGSMVYHCGKLTEGIEVTGASRKRLKGLVPFDISDGLTAMQGHLRRGDYIINCIGITKPYCHDNDMKEVRNAIRVNAQFPHDLAVFTADRGVRVFQIATDCVYSGAKGGYTETDLHDPLDVYGKTKSLGEVRMPNFLNIRCSIIGPEIFNQAFLLEWFLKQPAGSSVKGFAHHAWNGVTTLQFARICYTIISSGCFDELSAAGPVHHFLPNSTVSKYELLSLFEKVYTKGVRIEKSQTGAAAIDRTLSSVLPHLARLYPQRSMQESIAELKQFTDSTRFHELFNA